MSETNVDNADAVENTTTDQVVEPQLTELEQEAISEGWQPKEDWVASGKPESEWRSAREFKDRGELLRKIQDMGKELNSTRSTLTALKGHYEKVQETEFKRALDMLKAEKREALAAGDADAVIEIDDDIEKVKEEQRKAQAQAQAVPAPEIHPNFTNWVNSNRWYDTQPEMRAFADSIGKAYALSNPGIQPVEVLKYVSSKVKQAYPDKFQNPARSKPSAVESSAPAQKKVTASDDVELTPDEQRTMAKFVRSGLMTEAEFKADIKKINAKEKR